MSRLQREVDQIVKEANAKIDAERTHLTKTFLRFKKIDQYLSVCGFILMGYIYVICIACYGAAQYAGFSSTDKTRLLDPLTLLLHLLSIIEAVSVYPLIKELNNASSEEEIHKLALSFWEEVIVIASLVVATFVLTSPLLVLASHALLVLICGGIGLIFYKISYVQQKGEKEAAALHAKVQSVMDTASQEDWEELKTVKLCEICQKESKYDLCLACEEKYRGERHRLRAQLLRAKQAGVDATLTLKEWLDILNTFHWRCAYCHGEFHALEHYVPIIQGGGTTAENCLPACTTCNSKKAGNHPDEESYIPRPFQAKASATSKRTNQAVKKSK